MITAEHFNDVANSMRDRAESCEATRRTVIGRAYYSAYHACKEFCTEIDGWKDNNATSHELLIQSLTGSKDIEVRKLGNRLKSMRVKRVISDYNLKEKVPGSDMRRQLTDSRLVLCETSKAVSRSASK